MSEKNRNIKIVKINMRCIRRINDEDNYITSRPTVIDNIRLLKIALIFTETDNSSSSPQKPTNGSNCNFSPVYIPVTPFPHPNFLIILHEFLGLQGDPFEQVIQEAPQIHFLPPYVLHVCPIKPLYNTTILLDVKGKCKVLCLTKHHATKNYWGS